LGAALIGEKLSSKWRKEQMSLPSGSLKVKEFRDGWKVLLAATMGSAINAVSLPFYTIGVFAPFLAREFHWGYGEIQASLLVNTFACMLVSPLVGAITDRVGARRVALCSVVLLSVFFMGFGAANGSPWMLYASALLVAVGGAGTLPITWSRAINARFESRKGAALGISAAGSGLFGAVVKPLSAWLILTCGWRLAYAMLGLLPLVLVWPTVYLFFFEKTTGQAPASRDQRFSSSSTDVGVTLAEAVKSWRFWALIVFVIGVAISLGGVLPNVESILKSKGSSTSEAVSIAQLIGVSIVMGRLTCGWLLDKLRASILALLSLLPAALALALLSQPDQSLLSRGLSIVFLGAAAGMEVDFMAYLTARYFGLRHYGAIYGILYGVYAVCTGIGAIIYGTAYDRAGSFSTILFYAAAIPAVAAIIPLTIGGYLYVQSDKPVMDRALATGLERRPQ
jgi:MFS family permease